MYRYTGIAIPFGPNNFGKMHLSDNDFVVACCNHHATLDAMACSVPMPALGRARTKLLVQAALLIPMAAKLKVKSLF